MKTIIISAEKLIELISAHAGATIIGIVADTDAKLRKTGNPFGAVRKITRKAAFTGLSYESQVTKASGTEFESSPLPWGEWHVANKVIAHKGEFYLAIQSNEKIRKFNPASVRFIAQDGKELSRSDVAPFMPEKKVSAKQEDAGLTEKTRIDFTPYAFRNLKRVRVGGKNYSIA